MENKGVNDYFNDLVSEYTSTLITYTIEMVKSIKEEDYENSVEFRNKIKVITESIIIQSNHLLHIPNDILREHFGNITQDVYERIIKEFDKNNN